MRTRFALLWATIVIGIALMLPAGTVAASGYTYKTVYNYCNGDQVNLKMKNKAAGHTPANKLTIESWAQRRTAGGWRTVYTWDTSRYRFEANGYNHTLIAWRQYNGHAAAYFRIVFRLRAWQGNNLLASSTFKSVRC